MEMIFPGLCTRSDQSLNQRAQMVPMGTAISNADQNPVDVLSIFPPHLNSVAGTEHLLAPGEVAPIFPHKLRECLLTIKNF